MTRQAVIPWSDNDTAEALQQRYRAEPEGIIRTRLHALWLLRQPEGRLDAHDRGRGPGGSPVHGSAVAEVVPEGGLAQVCGRRKGGPGKPSFLTKAQEQQVVAEAATGMFGTGAGGAGLDRGAVRG